MLMLFLTTPVQRLRDLEAECSAAAAARQQHRASLLAQLSTGASALTAAGARMVSDAQARSSAAAAQHAAEKDRLKAESEVRLSEIAITHWTIMQYSCRRM